MSLKVKPRNQQRSNVSSRGFSSSSVGSYSIPRISSGTNQIHPVTVNTGLLTPMKIDIDPSLQAERTEEKEQIKGLNDRFVKYIEKVRGLEQQNKMLETKWTLLQGQTNSRSSIEPMLKTYIADLQKQLDLLSNDKQKLDSENLALTEKVHEYRTMYELELNRRTEAENNFVLIKKDLDTSYMSKVELDEMVVTLKDEILFLTAVYEQELHELKASVNDVSVVVEIDNSRDLNMDHIIADVKAQYEDVAAQSRAEAERWYKTKFNQMAAEADQYNTELRSSKADISELTRIIRQLQGEVSNAKMQSAKLQANIDDAEESGQMAVQDAKSRINDLEEALKTAKQNMARQIREYQDLMSLKMALDIEISTYRKMLEGEEERLFQGSHATIKSVHKQAPAAPAPAAPIVQNHTQRRSGPLVIKTVETKDTSYA